MLQAATASAASPTRRPESSANPTSLLSSPNPGAAEHDRGGEEEGEEEQRRLRAGEEQDDDEFVGRTRSRTRSRSRSKSKNRKAGKPLVLVENAQGDAVVFAVPSKQPSALHHPNQRPPWQADADAYTCYTCDKAFTLRRRKHHCRACGKVVCGKCSPKEEMRPLPELGYTE